jgi:hypothetical protein
VPEALLRAIYRAEAIQDSLPDTTDLLPAQRQPGTLRTARSTTPEAPPPPPAKQGTPLQNLALPAAFVAAILGTGLVWWLARPGRHRPRLQDDTVEEPAPRVSPAELLARIDRLHADGHTSEAVHLLLVSLLERLGAGTEVRPVDTARMVMERISPRHPQRPLLEQLVRVVEATRWAGREVEVDWPSLRGAAAGAFA